MLYREEIDVAWHSSGRLAVDLSKAGPPCKRCSSLQNSSVVPILLKGGISAPLQVMLSYISTVVSAATPVHSEAARARVSREN
jgi:hypothetical protein